MKTTFNKIVNMSKICDLMKKTKLSAMNYKRQSYTVGKNRLAY